MLEKSEKIGRKSGENQRKSDEFPGEIWWYLVKLLLVNLNTREFFGRKNQQKRNHGVTAARNITPKENPKKSAEKLKPVRIG
jgi:hypothetical protein